ncbi:MAG: transposase, partial [Flavobacterium sp.]
LDFFNVSNVIVSDQGFNIYLEEKNVVPAEFKGQRLTSKGFMDEIKVQDFPIRGKAGYLIVKRRRWINQTTLSIVSRNWNYVAQGTRMTKEFADFLKVIARY